MPTPSHAILEDSLERAPLSIRFAVGWDLLLGIAAVLCLHAWLYDFISDDAFIVARYARNVVDGHGWVYNVGDRVEGYTSFVWVALTATLGRLGLDYVLVVRALSIASAVGCAAVMILCAPRLRVPRSSLLSLLGAALFAATGSVACWALGGLETCGFALAVLGTLLAAESLHDKNARPLVAGTLSGLCALIRPEGGLILFILIVWFVAQGGEHRWRRVLLLVLPWSLIVGAHLLWRQQYYGDWLPNTFYAKVGTTPEQVQRGFRYVSGFVADHGGALVWIAPFVWPWLGAGPRFARLLSATGLVLAAAVILLGGDGLPMYRFMVPIVPLWALLAQSLVSDLLRVVTTAQPSMRPVLARTALVSLLLLLFVPLLTPPRLLDQFGRYQVQRYWEVPNWRAAGEWLTENAPPDASVACVPIGAVGYYSNLRLFDMMGLTDAHIARLDVPLGGGWAGHEKHDGPYILSREPTYLLLGNVQVLDAPLQLDDPRFLRPESRSVRHRERDIFGPELEDAYTPRVEELSNGRFLHFLQRIGNAPHPGD